MREEESVFGWLAHRKTATLMVDGTLVVLVCVARAHTTKAKKPYSHVAVEDSRMFI